MHTRDERTRLLFARRTLENALDAGDAPLAAEMSRLIDEITARSLRREAQECGRMRI